MRELYGKGKLAPSQVAERLGMTRGAITKLADRLIVKSMLRREADARDGRAQLLELTAEGRRLVPKLAKLADENDAGFFRVLPAGERAELQRMLRKIVKQHGWKQIPVE
jgi:DNA-binding MarR family transcriptional regulator